MFVRLRRTRTLIEATLVRSTLNAAGIPVQLVGEMRPGIIGEIPVPDAMVEVRVDASQVLHAEAVLAALDSAGEGAAWRCGGCGEENPAAFDLCWTCGKDRLG